MRITTYDTEIDPKTELPVLVKERSVNYETEALLQSPRKIVEMMNDVFRLGYATEEKVFLIAQNNNTRPIGIFEISRGTVKQSFLGPREILMKSLLVGASCISICHNHPSNDPTPSRSDVTATVKLKEVCQLLGITLLPLNHL